MVQTFSSSTEFDIPYRILCPVYFLRYPNPIASHVLSVDVLSREVLTRPRLRSDANGPSSSRAAEKARAVDANDATDVDDYVNVLKTTRLILKKGTLPKWAPKGLIRNAESWVLEESEVELDAPTAVSDVRTEASASTTAHQSAAAERGRTMRSWTRNLDHTTVMAVTEHNVFTEGRGVPHRRADAGSSKTGPVIGISSLDTSFEIESGMGFSILRNRIEKFGLNRVVTHVDSSRQGIVSTYARFLQERGLRSLAAAAGASAQGALEGQVMAPQQTKRQRLAAALRPPFLDGDFVGPFARMRQRMGNVRTWWKGLVRGGTGNEDQLGVRRSSGAVVDIAPQEKKVRWEQNNTFAARLSATDEAQAAPKRPAQQTRSQDSDNRRDELTLTPMELLRKRILHLRDGEAP